MPREAEKSTSTFFLTAISKSSGDHESRNLNNAHSGVNAGGDGDLTIV